MPRETIRSTVNGNDVSVGWQRGGGVQVGVEPADSNHAPEAMWSDLSRVQINDLIRLLRKARDSAYGADA